MFFVSEAGSPASEGRVVVGVAGPVSGSVKGLGPLCWCWGPHGSSGRARASALRWPVRGAVVATLG